MPSPSVPRPIVLVAPRLDSPPAPRAIQAIADRLAVAGYYLATGSWREPGLLPGLAVLQPAAVLVLGPLDDPQLRATVAAMDFHRCSTHQSTVRRKLR